MVLLSIAGKLWRYKVVTLPIVLLTFCGVAYVVAVKQPVYEASSRYILINPPPPPSSDDVARDPALRRLDSDNPYTRFTDQSVMVEVLASSMTSKSTRRALVTAGADSRYTVAPSSGFGFSKPIVQVTAEAWNPEAAVRSARLVGNALTRELARLQQAQGVDSKYQIKAQLVDPPDGAKVQASAQLRVLVAVLALGVVLLFVVVSVADALATVRAQRLGRTAPSAPTANGEPWSADRAEGLPDLELEPWSQFDEDLPGDGHLVELFPDFGPMATARANGRARAYARRRVLLKVIWFLFAGFWMAIAYAVAALIMVTLVITVPLGVAPLRIGTFTLWPYGKTVVPRVNAGSGSAIGNVLWLLLAGWWLILLHLVTSALLCVTIVGLPLARANFELIPVAFRPFGWEVVPIAEADRQGLKQQILVPADAVLAELARR
jgi:uncharacterized membrane protein YccF (DUF307 family)